MSLETTATATALEGDGLQQRHAKLRRILASFGRVGVAFSGGVDSSFVLKAAAETLGVENVIAFTGRSPSLAAEELADAIDLARLIGVEHVVVATREFENPAYLANPVNRCYYCKTELYGRLRPMLAERGLTCLVNGINADDESDFRPGMKAASEFGVRAPCAEAGLTKSDIRVLSAALGLPTADKPAAPCLSSRLPYGEAVTPEKLRMVEQAERVLHELGFRACRVRHHGALARIEVPEAEVAALAAEPLRGRVERALRELGYNYVCVDLRGLRSGSLNEVIAFGRRQAGE